MNIPTITITLPPDYIKPPLPGGRELFDALKSGKYEKGSGQLCRDEKYCCLGVKCELDGLLKEDKREKYTLDDPTNPASINNAFLPDNHQWRKLYGSGLSFPGTVNLSIVYQDDESNPSSIVAVNDYGGKVSTTFDQVADVLEQIFDLDAAEIVKN